ncbi:hypothetical protein DFH27DRAFT_463084, partial [Peziza echinospora]
SRIDSLETIISQLQSITGYRAQVFHCCPKQCMAYTGEYQNLDACPICGESRYLSGQPRKKWLYIPVIPRLLLQYSSKERAALLQ